MRALDISIGDFHRRLLKWIAGRGEDDDTGRVDNPLQSNAREASVGTGGEQTLAELGTSVGPVLDPALTMMRRAGSLKRIRRLQP